MTADDLTLAGVRETIHVHRWGTGAPRYVVLLAHGYGEHAGRYEHVARALVADGAAVFAPDHAGHGRSTGERALVQDIEELVSDLHAVAGTARAAVPAGTPVVLIGHSMGGIVATRYAQQHGDGLAALVLSGPAIGGNPDLAGLLELDPIPDIPIDPAILSRDHAVGEAYAADGLVYHGPFRKATLLAFVAAITAIAEGPSLGELPTLWIHGEQDALAPLEPTREAMQRIRGPRTQEKVYLGAQHEIFNETNRAEVIVDVLTFVGGVLEASGTAP